MPNAHRTSTIMSNSSSNGKNSLTFESVVCSQLELKRRAASFSRRRSTMCRRPSSYISTITTPSNPVRTSSPISPSNSRTSTSVTSDISIQFLKTKNSNSDNKRSRTSSINSINATGLGTIGERQSLVSMLYWDGPSSRSTTIKKVINKIFFLLIVIIIIIKDGSRASKWSIDFQKERPHYGSLRSRLIEEYTDCESLLEFAKKTVLVLMKTSNSRKKIFEFYTLKYFLQKQQQYFLVFFLFFQLS